MGVRIKIEYDDQNEAFSQLLPRTGTVLRRVKVRSDGGMWSLIRLDEPFQYRWYASGLLPVHLFNCNRLLIRSRWAGHDIGESEPVSVFILLAFDDRAFDEDEIDLEKCHHVAWGLCSCEGEVAA